MTSDSEWTSHMGAQHASHTLSAVSATLRETLIGLQPRAALGEQLALKSSTILVTVHQLGERTLLILQ